MTVAADVAEVSFWGTRGSVSTPGRRTEKYGGNTPCITVGYQDTMLIVDGGTGLRILGNHILSHGPRYKNLHLLLTHTHWDHIQGLPFFVPAYLKGTVFTIYGSPHKGGFLESILRGQMDYDYFPVDMGSLGAEMNIVEMEQKQLQFGPILVSWEEQKYHPGGSLRFRFDFDGKRVVVASDVELNKFIGTDYPSDEERSDQQAYMQFINKADLLIADGQYTEEEYPAKVNWGHTSVELLLETAYRAGVKKLSVFHHDPEHSDEKLDHIWQQYAPGYEQASPPMQVFWAREGMSVPV